MKLDELKIRRKKKGLSRHELASLSNLNIETIKALENGTTNVLNAKLSTLISLAKVLKCRVRDFYPLEKLI